MLHGTGPGVTVIHCLVRRTCSRKLRTVVETFRKTDVEEVSERDSYRNVCPSKAKGNLAS